MKYVLVLHIDDGKITESWGHFLGIPRKRQAGQVPYLARLRVPRWPNLPGARFGSTALGLPLD